MFTGTASLAATLGISVLFLAGCGLAEDFELETTAGDAFIIIEVEERDSDDQECSFTPPAKFTNNQNMKLEPVRGEDADCSPICEYRQTSGDNGWTYEFYGTSDTDCGIQINNVDPNDHGNWVYISGAEYGNIAITVNVIPSGDDIFFEAAGDDPDPDPKEILYHEDTEVTFSCIVEGIRPVPEDDDVLLELENGTSVRASLTYSDYPYNDGSYVEEDLVLKADFVYYPERDHTGQALVCVVKIEDTEGGEVRGIPWELDITGTPGQEYVSFLEEPQMGSELWVEVGFVSNPAPTGGHWELPGGAWLDAFSVEEEGRFRSSGVAIAEGDHYASTLEITELLEEDLGQEVVLVVENGVGYTEMAFSLPDTAECEAGWVGSEDLSTCYFTGLTPATMAWAPAATSFCPSIRAGSYLAEIKSEDELGFLRYTLGADGLGVKSVWVGASQLQTRGVFRWSGGEILEQDSSLWGQGQPGGQDFCVALSADTGYNLHDVPCNRKLAPLCQYDME